MEILKKKVGNAIVAAIKGRLTVSTADLFRKQLSEITTDSMDIVLDLTEMEYIDSTGLGAIVYVLQSITDSGGNLKLAGLQPKPRLVFNITKAYKLFDIYDTLSAALGQDAGFC